MNVKKAINIIIWALYSGICIGIGGTAYLYIENKIVGSFLFAIGLLTILMYGMNLFTGKVGYIVRRKPAYCLEVLFTWIGNFAGTVLVAQVMRHTRNTAKLIESCTGMVETKLNDSYISLFVLGIFCGMLMFIAVDSFQKCKKDGREFLGTLMCILGVVVFIQSGFEHCVADMFYFALCGKTVAALLPIIVITLGNALGGNLIHIGQIAMEKVEGK
ncbi:MAG: formate/nitrite transporter family protein [Lachnospiraceae bacterium]|nr:formate/nitrite transporter family protein [Lachnospiraceae bacterium]